MLDKTFEAAEVEPRILDAWEKAGAFRAGAGAETGARPFSIVIPPPNVTGSLHMGHALNNTLQDILIRFERMRGRDVLWQPGTDHAGIATQMVVERQLAEAGTSRRELGRDAFVRRVWGWKEQSEGAITAQLKRLGASCDWSRERFTLDEGLSAAVRKVFVALHKAGLVYRDKRLVNWDPKFQTAISDLEVQSVEVKGHLWHVRYPIEGSDEAIVVATTRPETMLGDTAVGVHPDDERWKHLVGRNAILPLVGRKIPIVADPYSDPEKGTGAVKITPAHDFNDFEVGRRHGLPLVNVLDAEARMNLAGNPAFTEGVEPSADLMETLTLHGLDRFEVRRRILARLEAAGLLEKTEPHVHAVPHGDRSGVPIEPFLTDQWYVDAKTLAEPAIAAVREGRTRFVPENWARVYFDWLENVQPWCVSRQLWWGHQIPAWYGPDGAVFVEETEEEAAAAAERHYGRGVDLRRDEDVLDTWFSSALWPFSTLGWPEETPELRRYYPTSVLVTGFDIIFFWVARMMMMGLYFTGEAPFRDVYIHALVRDERGAKMSKSKGNVIDPLDLASEYGADALRFTLAAMAAQGRDIKLATGRVAGYRNFATKLWNAARFAEMNSCRPAPDFPPLSATTTLNRWILVEASRTRDAVTDAIETYRFNDAAGSIYGFVWHLFCDWYLELAKPVFSGEDEAAKAETRATCGHVLDEILKLLHPFMPFVTEELWARLAESVGVERERLLALSRWPAPQASDGSEAGAHPSPERGGSTSRSEVGVGSANAGEHPTPVPPPGRAKREPGHRTDPPLKGEGSALRSAISAWDEAATEIGWLIALVTEIRSVRSEMNVPAGAAIPLVVLGADEATRRRLKTHEAAVLRLARIERIEHAAAPPAEAAQIVLGEATYWLPLAGVIDISRERARLEKETKALDSEIAKIDAKLANPDFLARAPEEVVEENRERREAALARRAKIAEALTRLVGPEPT